MSILNELSLFAKNYTILIVEDDKELNEQLVEITTLFFKDVDFAFNGKEALEKYRLKKYDLIISDITMPQVNGIELSREIRNIDRQQQIVVLSAHQEIKYLIDLIDIGVNQFVAKPFEENELLYRLLKVCENLFYKDEYLRLVSNESPIAQKKEEKIEVKKIESSSTKQIIKKNKKINDSTASNSVISHKRVDAKNFMTSIKKDNLMWNAFEDQIEELFDLSDELNEQIEKIFLNNISKSTVIEVAIILRKIESIFSFTDELSKLGKVLLNLAVFLESLEVENLNDEKKNKLKLLEFIYDDISRFIETVFVYEDTLDVFYLEDSLNSSVEQLKMNLGNVQIEEEELELF